MCDEGRYGFDRFLPKRRITAPYQNKAGGTQAPVTVSEVISAIKGSVKTTAVLVGPDLLLEEYYLLRQLLSRNSSVGRVVVAYRERQLTTTEAILISPDYACNFRGAQLSGLVGEALEADYTELLSRIRRREIDQVLVVGDRAVADTDIDSTLLDGLSAAKMSAGILTDADSELAAALKMVVPGRSILEKAGLLVNRKGRIQYTDQVVPFPEGSMPEWRFLALLAEAVGVKILPGAALAMSDRELTRWYLSTDSLVSPLSLTIAKIKSGGVQIPDTSDRGTGQAA
jgi:NADH dehydrogenase/NADH:ubiquinone oxidoreductase subunit G